MHRRGTAAVMAGSADIEALLADAEHWGKAIGMPRTEEQIAAS